MTIPREAVTLENFQRAEKGLPPILEPKVIREEPEFPKIQNRIEFAKVPLDKVLRIGAIRKNIVKNKDGVRFIGYDIEIEMKDSKSLQGWILEGDLHQCLPYLREKTDKVILGSI